MKKHSLCEDGIWEFLIVDWGKKILFAIDSDLLPVHPASFAHNFVSGMQIFYFSESQDAIVF